MVESRGKERVVDIQRELKGFREERLPRRGVAQSLLMDVHSLPKIHSAIPFAYIILA